ncbi:MAG: LysR family transcriptional regulator [Xanthobacteraceae bacterium]|nr:LysR family transcriptional regulator [Xanthobacteraceae bacterium]
MQDLNDLYYFVQVVDHGGFASAARALGMPRSRLSRRIAALEDRLGVRLIQRSTRRFSVTPIGQDYHHHCVAMLVEARAADELIARAHSKPRGVVRLSCPPPLLYFQVGEMVARFMAECPDVEVHLESTPRRVDVIAEGFDIALRVRFPPLADDELVMRVLAESTQRLVASPALIKSLDRAPVPADLARLPAIGWGPPHQRHEWCLDGPDEATASIPYIPRLMTEDMVALRFAALKGIGVGQFPTMMVKADLESGALVDVLPDWKPRAGIVHAVFSSRRGLLPSVRALLDFLVAEFAALDAAESGVSTHGKMR